MATGSTIVEGQDCRRIYLLTRNNMYLSLAVVDIKPGHSHSRIVSGGIVHNLGLLGRLFLVSPPLMLALFSNERKSSSLNCPQPHRNAMETQSLSRQRYGRYFLMVTPRITDNSCVYTSIVCYYAVVYSNWCPNEYNHSHGAVRRSHSQLSDSCSSQNLSDRFLEMM